MRPLDSSDLTVKQLNVVATAVDVKELALLHGQMCRGVTLEEAEQCVCLCW